MEDYSQLFESNPIIAAAKDEEQLQRALRTDCDIVFLLFGNICNVAALVDEAKAVGKTVFVHLDLTQGLATSKEVAAEFIRNFTKADGVISTRPQVLRHAKSLGLITVLRIFLVDSISLNNLKKQVDACDADAVDIMPGVMPKVIKKVAGEIRKPVITGGMIADKDDIIAALSAGAKSISTTCEELWRE